MPSVRQHGLVSRAWGLETVSGNLPALAHRHKASPGHEPLFAGRDLLWRALLGKLTFLTLAEAEVVKPLASLICPLHST